MWSYTSTPTYVFMTWCLVKHRDEFAFIFTDLKLFFRLHVQIQRVKQSRTANTRWSSCLGVEQKANNSLLRNVEGSGGRLEKTAQ
jgi:hypothetical protein